MLKYFDLHCDTPFKCYENRIGLDDPSLAINTASGDVFALYKQCFAFWIRDDAERPFELYRAMHSDFLRKFNSADTNIIPFFTVEGGALLENNAERLYSLAGDGIKSIGLSWNGKNTVASGVYAEGGVTDFGIKVIDIMNSLHIACDLSHLNKQSFYDALEHSYKPFVSHTCISEVNPHPRNLERAQICEVCSRNGIIGICLYPLFLGGDDVFEAFYKNIFYLLDSGFENSIAIGSDFDGADMNEWLSNVSKIPNLYSFLMEKGLSKTILNKIFFKNADNFFVNL